MAKVEPESVFFARPLPDLWVSMVVGMDMVFPPPGLLNTCVLAVAGEGSVLG